jgi:glycosyltransferase involved in cell wall biosynthesis
VLVISNGFSKFHLSVAAAEANRRRILSSFLTGAYPTPLVRNILSLPMLRNNAKARRLIARRERVDDGRVHAFFWSEALHALAIRRRSDAMILESHRAYQSWATHLIRRAAADGARIYHYRAGVGGESVEVARELGMFALCDHSIAHPSVLQALVENHGSLTSNLEDAPVSPFWMRVLRDIERADAVLVNSSFVEHTFRHVGFECSDVHVVYLGIDDAFLAQIPKRENTTNTFRMLFAGSFEKRKGVEILIEALDRLTNMPWQLEIAGQLDSEVVKLNRTFFSDPRVIYLGILSRRELANAMSRANVFVFPSLAEGSARVIFEALACGCYVITTPNSGSIVEPGVHGSIVPPGDSVSLATAVEHAYDDRDAVAEIGARNARLVKSKYRQCDYGDQLFGLYNNLLKIPCCGGVEGHAIQ